MGKYQNSIDAKNRLIVPSKLRDGLGYKCVITRSFDNCLVIFPMSSWEQQQEKLSKLPRSDEKARAFLRYTYANAVDCEIDKQGRTVIPQFLREYAKIKKELVTIGMIDRVEVWAREVYEKDENGGKLNPEQFAGLDGSYQV